MDIAEDEEHPTDEQLGIKAVKVVCPVCGVVWYKDSLKELLNEIEKLWKPWLKFMTEEQKEKLRSYNNLSRLREILEKRGFVQCFCLKCQVAATVKIWIGIAYSMGSQ